MSETANYGLYTCDDSSTKFLEWRLKMNGPDDSNMVKIDSILAQLASAKAEASRVINTVLNASGWSGSSAPFTQALQIEGLTAEQNGIIGVPQDSTDEQYQAACNAKLRIGAQTDGSLTILAKGVKPSCDIPIIVITIG